MRKFVPLFFLSFTLLFGACSGETRTIEVYGIDQMKYVVKEKSDDLQVGESLQLNGETYYYLEGINAAAGEELKIILTTISTLPASAMSHNWLLLSQDTDVQAFVSASIQAKDNGYVAPDMQNQVLQNTGLVAGGESAEITFTAPDQSGDYEYLCSFPGHFSAGMRGTLSVQ